MTGTNTNTSIPEKQQFPAGGGHMGELIRSKNWSATSIGTPGNWPQSLRTTLNIILNCKFPMFLWWGPELICFYNDAYRPSLGDNGKHPVILGMPAKDAWAEIWEIIQPLIDTVLATGEATWSEDQLVPIFRNGKVEEVYWTFSYSPVMDEFGKVTGVLVTCAETTDKMITYKKLEENKERLEFAIEAAELGTWDYNPLTNKFTANARLKSWFGLPPEKEIELDYAVNAIAEKDRRQTIDAIKRALNYDSGGNYEVEYSIINPATNHEIIVQARGKAWFNEENQPVRFNGTLEDVTQEVLARQIAAQSQQRFSAAIDAVQGILWTNDASGKMTGEQPGWASLTGQTFEEYQGYGWANAVHPDDAQPTIDGWNEALKERKIFIFEHRVKNIAGYYEHFSIRAVPLLNMDGSIREWVGVHTNITHRKTYEAAIRESEKRFRNMVMQSPVPMTIIRGEKFIIETVNRAMLEDIWQKSEADTTGRPLLDVFPELKEQKYAELMNSVFTSGETHREKEAAGYIKVNGEIKRLYLDFEYAPLFETDNSISGLIITINDVTEKVEARQTIEASEQRLRSLVESAPFPIAVYTGLEMRIQFVNQSVIDIWGKGKDIVGRTYAEVLPELANQGIYQQLENVFTTAIPFHAHNQRVDLMVDNKMKSQYFNYSFTPLFDINGKVYGVMNTAADVTDLVVSKQKVEESEKEFRQLADSLPELVWTTDSAGNQLFASRRWKEFTGLDPYDADTFDKMIHPDDRENVLYAWTVSLASGDIYKTQLRLKSKEGDYQWFYVHGEPIRDEEGKIEKWVGSFTNLNEQKKVEEELISAFQKIEESEKRFRNVANSAPVFIWMAGADKQRYFFNTAWFDFTGRTMEQEKGDGWIEGVHPDDREKCFTLYGEAFSKQQEYQMEYRLRRYDGTFRWISARGVARFTPGGVFEGFIGACMDIHEQVITQKKLKEEEERLNIIVDASDLGTWELNLNTMEVIYSGRYIEIFGYDADAKLSHSEIVAHIHPDDLLKRKIAFETAVITGVLSYESRIIGKDKTLRWVENKGKVFYDEDNRPQKIIGTTRDTTEEKNYEQQLLEREQKFRLLADSMPQFVWTGDAEGNLNYFSRAVYEYSGLSPEQMEREGWLQIVHPDDRKPM